MGGAGRAFDNLGIDMVSLIKCSHFPSVLYLNRLDEEEIEVEQHLVDIEKIWQEGQGGIYSLTDYVYDRFRHRYPKDPRILVTGPAASSTDFGAIASLPIRRGDIKKVETWAGRGGFGSRMFQTHGVAAIIYGGNYINEKFRDRKSTDQWFMAKYNQTLAQKDHDSTTKYRFDPKLGTGGTLGVNYATMSGTLLCFNYKSIYMEESERNDIHKRFILDHYLKQFNEHIVDKKQHKNCGEPCAALCKKTINGFKKDYEPYQTMGPLCGIFDQRAAEQLNHHCDRYGFDAIAAGGVVAWLMECLDEGLLTKEDLGVSDYPVFSPIDFDVVEDSQRNAQIGIEILDSIVQKRGIVDLQKGARRFARYLTQLKNKKIKDLFIYSSFASNGWMVPNQYWTPGVLSPMAIMGKYYMYYGSDYLTPRELGRRNAERMKQELILDNSGVCRFHRGWAEEMIPEIIGSVYGLQVKFLLSVLKTATRINARNSSTFLESERNLDFIYTFLKRKRDVEGCDEPDLQEWIAFFEKDKKEAGRSFWYEIHKGIMENLMELPMESVA
jgi:glyceraldehyde-3-phosphate dehydrogenase (ferredoxin)